MKQLENLKYYLVTDRAQSARPLEEAVEETLRAGFRTVQLREKDLSSRELLFLASKLREISERYHALLIVNDRADIALAVGADGVHLGWKSMPVSKVRELVGKRLIGVSTHNLKEALEAEKAGADYVTVGPVFDTLSKQDVVPTLGLAGLKEVKASLSIPVIALGGIDSTNVDEIVACGVDGIAMVRAVLSSPDPYNAARTIIAALT